KYDPNVGGMLALLRYGTGLPMYRIAKHQQDLGVPLPATTQWGLIAEAADSKQAVYQALIQAAAQGKLIHHDDTYGRVQSLRQEIEQQGEQAQRTGIFTTGLVCDLGPAQAALFFTGQNHAGENLQRLLQQRAAGLEKPLQMCDAL